MRRRIPMVTLVLSWAVLGCDQNPTVVSAASRPELSADKVGTMFLSSDPSGQIGTLSTTGTIDLTNPFFQSLGTNGRSCVTCHLQNNAFGLSAAAVQATFAATNGADPLFAAVDGANCPTAANSGSAPLVA